MAFLKSLAERIFKPIRTRRLKIVIIQIGYILLYVRSLLYTGKTVYCPVCNGNFRKFLPYGIKKRLNAQCPRCLSLERHRALWLYLQTRTNLFKDNLKLLDFAPVPYFQLKFQNMKNLEYISADISLPWVDVNFDIMNIPYADNTFDAIICYHILEHVKDDRKAIKELYRVLKLGGWAIIHSPINKNLKNSIESTVISPEEFRKIEPDSDHVRIYGLDYYKRLEESGFTIKVDKLDKILIEKYGLMKDDEIVLCYKS